MINCDKTVVVKENHVRRKCLHRLAEDHDFGPDAAGARATMHERRTAVATSGVITAYMPAVALAPGICEQTFVDEKAWQR